MCLTIYFSNSVNIVFLFLHVAILLLLPLSSHTGTHATYFMSLNAKKLGII